VSSYRRRDGTVVHSYTRGSLVHRPLSRSKVVSRRFYNDSTEGGPEAWEFTFSYRNGRKEKVTVIAPSYEKAMDEAFENRQHHALKPIAITMVDPSLWGAVKSVVRGAGKVARYGGRRAKFTVKKHTIMGMLNDAYSDNKVRRTAARIALKQSFPEVYAMCDFSRERRFGARRRRF